MEYANAKTGTEEIQYHLAFRINIAFLAILPAKLVINLEVAMDVHHVEIEAL